MQLDMNISKGAFMLNLRTYNQRFETLILNAVHGCADYAHFFRARERADFVNMHCACAYYVDPRRQVKLGRALSRKFWIQAIVKLAICSFTCKSIIAHCAIFARAGPGRAHFHMNRKGVYMTSLWCDYMWGCVYASPESAFCTNHVQKRTFLCVLNQRLDSVFIRKWAWTQLCFCTNHVWKRWFWPQKVEHKRTQSCIIWLRSRKSPISSVRSDATLRHTVLEDYSSQKLQFALIITQGSHSS